MDLFKSKKASQQELEERKKMQTANEFINVKDIIDSVLYSKDGYVYAFLKISPISLDLLSAREKERKIRNFSAEFSSEKKSFKFFSISRPVDISGISSWLASLLQESTDPMQKELLISEMKEIATFATTGDVIERQFYLLIWELAKEDGVKELYRRANEMENKFSACEINAELCGEESIIRLLNLFANPNYAHMEDGDVEPTIPFLKRTSARKK